MQPNKHADIPSHQRIRNTYKTQQKCKEKKVTKTSFIKSFQQPFLECKSLMLWG